MGDFAFTVREAVRVLGGEVPARKVTQMVAASAEINAVGKTFSILKDAGKALEMEKGGKEVVWVNSLKDLTDTLRDRSGINNVVVVEDHSDHRVQVWEFGVPVFTSPLDVISMLKGGGKAILYTASDANNYEANRKITADGTIKQRGSDNFYARNAAGENICHRFSLYAAYDKQKAKAAQKRQRESLVKRGVVDFASLQSAQSVLAWIVRRHYLVNGNYLFGPPYVVREREVIYKTIVFLAKCVDQLGISSKKFRSSISTYAQYRGGRWLKVPYPKWILSLRQYRRGLLTAGNGFRITTKDEWDSAGKEWLKVKKKTPVNGKSAREFGKWLDSEIRACIRYLRSRKKANRRATRDR